VPKVLLMWLPLAAVRGRPLVRWSLSILDAGRTLTSAPVTIEESRAGLSVSDEEEAVNGETGCSAHYWRPARAFPDVGKVQGALQERALSPNLAWNQKGPVGEGGDCLLEGSF